MPNYQSSPLYAPVFPTLLHNPHGVQPLKGNTLAYADLPAAGDSYQSAWKREADMAVMARLQNNKLKEKAMLRGPQSIKGNFSYTTGRGPNGHAFEGQKLSGGVATTAEGETMIQKLLRDRKFQLDAIDQSSFDTVAPERVKEAEPETDTFALDQLMNNLYSSIDIGTVTPSLLGMMNSITTFFATKADKIADNKFDTYANLLREMFDMVDSSSDQIRQEARTDSEMKRQHGILVKLGREILLLQRYIKDYTAYIGYPTKTKSLKLAAIRNKLLSSKGRYVPTEGEFGYEKAQAQEEQGQQGDEQYGQYYNAARYPGQYEEA